MIGATAAHAQSGPSPSAPQPQEPVTAPLGGGSEVPVAVDANFQLGMGDTVSVELVGRSDFTAHEQVSSEGMIVLPLVGKVKALGLTTTQLAQNIQTDLKKGGFFANPIVQVEVVGVASRYATILGDVTSPGLLPLDRTFHLSDVVARVGAHINDGPAVVILTHADGQSKRYSLEDIATGSGEGDPIVQPGDKIYVPSAAAEVFYVSGQVKNPGTFPLTPGMTVREAIARSGGLTPMGSEGKVKVFRKNERVRDVKLETLLQPGDIVQVGERLF